MKNRLQITDDDRWQSVVNRDVDADGQFVFAVQTTGIFLPSVLSCKTCTAQKMSVSLPMLVRRWLRVFVPVNAANRIKTARSSIAWRK